MFELLEIAKHFPERLDRRSDRGEGSACAALLQNAGGREVASCSAIVNSARGLKSGSTG